MKNKAAKEPLMIIGCMLVTSSKRATGVMFTEVGEAEGSFLEKEIKQVWTFETKKQR